LGNKIKEMISDNQTNTVYLSARLQSDSRFTAFCNNLTAILEKHKISYQFLENTRDIWCRDYMPVQITENKFIEYTYDPDYLKGEYSYSRSDPSIICRLAGIETIKTDIVIDGGNVVRYGKKVIMTDKLFLENPQYTSSELINKLEALFECEIIIIPWDRKYENRYGHADGLVRFIDEKTVLVNDWNGFCVPGEIALKNALTSHGLTIKSLKYDVQKRTDKWNWGYLNYLQLKDLLIIPFFKIEEDNQALDQFRELFPKDLKIETIDSREIIKKEGVLNCISWNVKL